MAGDRVDDRHVGVDRGQQRSRYEQVFARQLAGLAQPGDIVIAISTSGRSKNVLKAVERARNSAVARSAHGRID